MSPPVADDPFLPYPNEPVWMTTARRLEAEHREQATMRMYEAWLARADPQGVLSEQERIEVWRDCGKRQMSRINKYRKRPQMDDLREGMTEAERLAFDKGVQDGLLLAADACGSARCIGSDSCVLGKTCSQIYSIAEALLNATNVRRFSGREKGVLLKKSPRGLVFAPLVQPDQDVSDLLKEQVVDRLREKVMKLSPEQRSASERLVRAHRKRMKLH